MYQIDVQDYMNMMMKDDAREKKKKTIGSFRNKL